MEDEAPAGDDSHCRGGDRAGGMLRLAGLVLRFILRSLKSEAGSRRRSRDGAAPPPRRLPKRLSKFLGNFLI